MKDGTTTVGKCVCGRSIEIGEKYTLPLKGPTTLKRRCRGSYRGEPCGRINEVVLRVNAEVERANWHAYDCGCGQPIYLRADYSGEPELQGRFWERPEDKKNRTVAYTCPCRCRWKFQIRFKQEKNAEGRSAWMRYMNIMLQRCRWCAKLNKED